MMKDFYEVPAADMSGCYLLLWKGEVVYAGKSTNVLMRLTSHRNSMARYLMGKPGNERVIRFDTMRFCFCSKGEIDRLEAQLIARYEPRFNVKLKNRRDIDLGALIAKAGLEKEEWVTGLNLTDASENSRPSLRRF
jgi:excinuclease UvrABC nuclease subunit